MERFSSSTKRWT